MTLKGLKLDQSYSKEREEERVLTWVTNIWKIRPLTSLTKAYLTLGARAY